MPVRIGFDLGPVQASWHGFPGVAWYGRLLVEALLARVDDHQYCFYFHDGLATDKIPASPRATVRRLAVAGTISQIPAAQTLNWLARTNPDALDVLVILDPFQRSGHEHPPAQWSNGLKLATVVHGLDRYLAQQASNSDPGLREDYLRLETLRGYDLFLADSEGTRNDCLAILGLAENRVTTLCAAGDAGFYVPEAHNRCRQARGGS